MVAPCAGAKLSDEVEVLRPPSASRPRRSCPVLRVILIRVRISRVVLGGVEVRVGIIS